MVCGCDSLSNVAGIRLQMVQTCFALGGGGARNSTIHPSAKIMCCLFRLFSFRFPHSRTHTHHQTHTKDSGVCIDYTGFETHTRTHTHAPLQTQCDANINMRQTMCGVVCWFARVWLLIIPCLSPILGRALPLFKFNRQYALFLAQCK